MPVIKNKELKKRVLFLSYKYKVSHIGSCLTAIDIIEEIYKEKKPTEKFVLSAGHAALGLYVVNEKRYQVNAEKAWIHHGTHPDRCKKCRLDCSSGSLGQGLPIALGMALADRKKNVYCLISDGETAEGSIWEALRIKSEQKLNNLKIYVNCNGWGALHKVNINKLTKMLKTFDSKIIVRRTVQDKLPHLTGQAAHYHVLSESDFLKIKKIMQ